MRSNDPYGASVQHIFLDLRLHEKNEKGILSTLLEFCVAEGQILVGIAGRFRSFSKYLAKKHFLSNTETLCVDIFETISPV